MVPTRPAFNAQRLLWGSICTRRRVAMLAVAYPTVGAAAARQATAPALEGRLTLASAGNPHDTDTDLTAPNG